MYPNLLAEMARLHIQQKDLAAELGITGKTMGAKLAGETDFKIGEMQYIKKRTGKSLDYLFSTEQSELTA